MPCLEMSHSLLLHLFLVFRHWVVEVKQAYFDLCPLLVPCLAGLCLCGALLASTADGCLRFSGRSAHPTPVCAGAHVLAASRTNSEPQKKTEVRWLQWTLFRDHVETGCVIHPVPGPAACCVEGGWRGGRGRGNMVSVVLGLAVLVVGAVNV